MPGSERITIDFGCDASGAVRELRRLNRRMWWMIWRQRLGDAWAWLWRFVAGIACYVVGYLGFTLIWDYNGMPEADRLFGPDYWLFLFAVCFGGIHFKVLKMLGGSMKSRRPTPSD